jgi:poly(3-hydroxybutyrate) depolymerase
MVVSWRADRIAAVVSIAGAQFVDSAKCKADSLISVLQIHVSDDEIISHQGGSIGSKPYPSAKQLFQCG